LDFHKFSKFIINFQILDKLPEANLYPKNIKFDSNIWTGIQNLGKFTSKYNYEHSISIFDIAGTIITTPPVKGTKKEVRTNHRIELKYEHKTRDWYEKQIFSNGKLLFKTQVKIKDIPKKPKLVPLFNIHSHPKSTDNKYSFFSDTDLNTLFSSNSLCIGLITDRFILACKHTESPPSLSQEQRNTLAEMNSQFIDSEEISSKELNSLGIILYTGKMKKKLLRSN
jgi:hypothetical protein